MSQEVSPDDLQKLVDDHAARLLEHFCSVTILTTLHDGCSEETASFEGGGGDLYARIGRAREFLMEQDEHVKSFVSKKGGKSK